MKQNQHGTFLEEINSFEVYPEIVFQEIFNFFEGKIILPSKGTFVFDGTHINYHNKSKACTWYMNKKLEITHDIYTQVTKHYEKFTNDSFYYHYWRDCNSFLTLSNEYEQINRKTVFHLEKAVTERRLKGLMKSITKFHQNPEFQMKIIARKI